MTKIFIENQRNNVREQHDDKRTNKTETLALKLGTNTKNGILTASQSLQAMQRSSPVG